MGNAANVIAAFREMIGAKNLSQTDLQDLIKDGIMAALARRYGPNVAADIIIDEAGGSAGVFGSSGGGILALEAAARGLAITKLAVWEPPYILDDTRPPAPADYRQQLVDLLAAGRRGDMVELFLTQAVGLPAEFVAPMRQSPF